MYCKTISRTKDGWRAILFTSEGGARYTTIDGPTLADMLESINETIKDWSEWKGYDLREERKEFRA